MSEVESPFVLSGLCLIQTADQHGSKASAIALVEKKIEAGFSLLARILTENRNKNRVEHPEA